MMGPRPIVSVVRIVIVVLFASLFTAATFGFLAQRSLDDSAGFSASMGTALQDPQVKSELQSSIRASVLDVAHELGDSRGVFGSLLASVGAEPLADAAALAVNTRAFEQAWDDWALILHRGLADVAEGNPNSDISVTGQDIKIQLGPLVKPLLGTGLAASLSGPVDSLLAGRSVVVDTGEDMESSLKTLGAFANARWLLAAGASLALALAVFIGDRRTRWLAICLAVAAVGLAVVAITLTIGESSIPNSTTPALNESVRAALTNGWSVFLWISAIVLLAGAVGLTLISRVGPTEDAADKKSI